MLGLGPLITEWPVPCVTVTSLPGVGLPSASCSVSVMVVVFTPSAVTGVEKTLIPALAAGGTPNPDDTLFFNTNTVC